MTVSRSVKASTGPKRFTSYSSSMATDRTVLLVLLMELAELHAERSQGFMLTFVLIMVQANLVLQQQDGFDLPRRVLQMLTHACQVLELDADQLGLLHDDADAQFQTVPQLAPAPRSGRQVGCGLGFCIQVDIPAKPAAEYA